MAREIDERVVQMQFENGNFEKGVNTTLKSLEKLNNGLKFDNAGKGLDILNSSVNKSNTYLSNIADGIETINNRFTLLGRIGLEVFNRLAHSAVRLGHQMINSLSFEGMMAGFREYELKMSSVQTILSNTRDKGTKLSEVVETLNQLNEYADKTVYSFSDMTRAIGQFTTAGVSLKDSAIAIKGLSNLAAAVGADNSSVARAQYQISQALSSGVFKLMDWKSIENANMGGDLFKNALMQTAKEMGKVIDKGKPFRDTLQKGWLTSEVFLKTLDKFATSKEYKFMEDAATQVRTFSKLIDTLKEAIGSGWARTWEIFIGDFDEATSLFTGISNVISYFINKQADARNEMLQFWKDAGGRGALLKGFESIFTSLGKILGSVSEAMKEVFKPITAHDLIKLSNDFRRWADSIKVSDETLDKIKRTMKGLFSLIDLGLHSIKTFISLVLPMGSGIKDLSGGILNITSRIGDFLVMFNNNAKKLLNSDDIKKFVNDYLNSGTILSTVIKAIGDSWDWLNKQISNFNILETSSTIFRKIGEGISYLLDQIKQLYKNPNVKLDFSGLFGILGGVGGLAIIKNINNVIKSLKNPIETILNYFGGDKLSGIGDKIGGIFDSVGDAINTFTNKIKFEILEKIAKSLIILSGAIFVLSLIHPDKLTNSLGALTAMLTQLMATLWIMQKATKDLNVAKSGAISATLISLSASLLILSAALKNISTINPEQMLNSILVLAAVFGEIVIFTKLIGQNGMKSLSGSSALLSLSVSMIIFSNALKSMSEIDGAKLLKALSAMGLILGELAIFSKISNNKGLISIGIAMNFIALSMIAFSGALALLGNINGSDLAKSLGAMGIIFLEIAAASKLIPNDLGIKAAGIVILAGAMNLIATSLGIVSLIDGPKMVKSLGTMALALGAIVLTLRSLNKDAILGATSIAIVAGALMLIIPAITALGMLPVSVIVAGLLSLASIFAVIGVSAALLSPVIPALLGLAGALTLLGVASLAIGAGLNLIATGFALIATTVVGGAGAIATGIVLIIKSIADMIPIALTKLGEGFVAFISEIGKNNVTLFEAFKMIVLGLLNVIETLAPRIAESAMILISSLLEVIKNNGPKIITTFIEILLILINIVGTYAPQLADAGVKLIIDFINGMANAMRDNAEPLIEAFKNLLSSMIELLLTVLQEIAEAIPGVGGFISDGIEGLKSFVRDTLTDGEFENAGKKIGNQIKTGIDDGLNDGDSRIKSFLDGEIENMKVSSPMFKDIRLEQINGFNEAGEGILSPETSPIKNINESEIAKGKESVSQFTDLRTLQLNSFKSPESEFVGQTSPIDIINNEELINANSKLESYSSTRNSQLLAFTSVNIEAGESPLDSINNSEISKINENATKIGEARTNQILSYTGQTAKMNTQIVKSGEDMTSANLLGMKKNDLNFPKLGTTNAMAYVDSIYDKQVKASDAGKKVSSSVVEATKPATNDMRIQGQNAGEGFAVGIETKETRIRRAARLVIQGALDEAKAALDSHSPSRKFMKLGFDSGEGYIIGLINIADRMVKTSKDIMNNVVYSIKQPLLSAFESDEIIPSITPVIDLSEIENGARKINQILPKDEIMASLEINNSSQVDKLTELVTLAEKILRNIQNGSDLYMNDDILVGIINRKLGER